MFSKKIKPVSKIPGKFILCLLLISMAYSTINAENVESSIKILSFFFVSILNYFILILTFRSIESIKTLLKWLIIIGFIFVSLNYFNFLQLSNFLPNTQKAYMVKSAIESQTTAYTGIHSGSTIIRKSFLWFDANSFGYLLATLFLFNLYFLFYERKILIESKYRYYLRYIIMFVFVISIIFTLSRGAILAFLLSSIFVFLFFKNVVRIKIKYLVLLGIFFLIIITMFPYVSEKLLDLSDRMTLGIGLFGYSKSNTVLTGLETGRLETALNAFYEFLERPVFGWGGGGRGKISNTSNHVYYINLLGRWGIVGFSLYLSLYLIIISKALKSLKVAKNLNSSIYGLGIALLGIFLLVIIKGFFAEGNILFSGGLLIAYCNSVNQGNIKIKKG
ncbi:MAG: hypothetical protein HQ555_12975 [Candidatus Aminicenantes bacterium]|nr:hypothetical protein [Candidatus Aminicenantes bacterium]